jgi:tetratricopeptide (TPR) repeat protein
MLIVCPSCGSENRDSARFCDQCGAALDGSAVTDQTNETQLQKAVATEGLKSAAEPKHVKFGSSRRYNFFGIGFIVALIVAVILLAFGGPRGGPETAEGEGAAMPAELLANIDQFKAALAEDPADTGALKELYAIYGQVGKQSEVREYLEKALDEIRARVAGEKMDADTAKHAVADVAQAAVGGDDAEGAILALACFYELFPTEVGVLPFLGNLCFDLGKYREAISWYDKYLEHPAAQGAADFTHVRIDRATMYLQAYEAEGRKADLDFALGELRDVTKDHPDEFNGWYNLGQAHKAADDKSAAEKAFRTAAAQTSDETEKWLAETELARLTGQPEPEPPPSHTRQGVGPAKEGVPNPHGEGFHGESDMDVGPAKPGVPNPHGEGFGGNG